MAERAGDEAGALRAELARLEAERDRALEALHALRLRLAEAERLADRDPLAPVLNRRAFMRELARASAFCDRYGQPAALLYLDLDGFKAVNDRWGHAAGDTVLGSVARGLLDHVRESDLVGRLGGDEFAVLLPRTDGPSAVAKAAALVAELEREPVALEGALVPVRLSAGVRLHEKGLSAPRWLAEADAAMFVRKGARRP